MKNYERPATVDRFPVLEHAERETMAVVAQRMLEAADVYLLDRAADVVLGGAGDTGNVVLESDLNNSEFLLAGVSAEYPGSFSEESEAQLRAMFPDAPLTRLDAENRARGMWMFDPVDGSGDRKYGQPGTPSGEGYAILATYLRDDAARAGLVYRPGHQQVLAVSDGRIRVYQRTEQGVTEQSFTAPQRQSEEAPVRVNVRLAYPHTNFPPDFWNFARQHSGLNFVETESGGAGDSLSRLVLGELDLVYSGQKGDWKSWDTGPFDQMVQIIGGQMTNADGQALGGYDREDLWHGRGVIAALSPEVHAKFVAAIAAYEQQVGKQLVFDPRKK